MISPVFTAEGEALTTYQEFPLNKTSSHHESTTKALFEELESSRHVLVVRLPPPALPS